MHTESCSIQFSALKGKGGGNEAAGTATGAAPPAGPAAPPAQQTVTVPPAGTTAATATAAGAAPASPAGTVAAPAPAADIAAEPNDQPVPVAGAPVKLKKDAKKSDRSGRDDNEPGSLREIETEIITRSLSLSKLQDMRKDFSCHPGEHIATWLLRCWDNGASSLELEGKEVSSWDPWPGKGALTRPLGKRNKSSASGGGFCQA